MNQKLRIMVTRKNVLVGLVFFIVLNSYFMTLASRISAQDFSLGIYPPIIQINATPPTAIRHDITLKNISDTPVTLHVIFKPFTASSTNNGELRYLSPSDIFGEDPHIFDKIQLLDQDSPVKNLSLAPKEQKTLTLHIGLPKDEPPSDYYFSILFTSTDTPLGEKNGSSIFGGIATNVLLSIGPKSPTTGFLEEFSTSWFVEKSPVAFTIAVHNLSSHFIIPRGQILIRNMFGQLIGKVDLLPVNILEGTSRYIPDKDGTSFTKAIWNEQLLFGVYRANLVISLSPEGPILLKTIYFLAIPLPYIIGISLTLIILIIIIVRVRKRLQ